MTKLNKSEKVVRWAYEKRNRNISHIMKELNYDDEQSLMFHLNRQVRKGLITFKRIGQMIQFNLTQSAYYGRSDLVNAR
jgi:predicted small secreted protein